MSIRLGFAAWMMALSAAAAWPANVAAQPKQFSDIVTDIEASFEPSVARPGQTVIWRLRCKIDPDWHTYSTEHDGIQKTQFTFPEKTGLTRLDKTFKETPPSMVELDADGVKHVLHGDKENGGRITWETRFQVPSDAPPGAIKLETVWKVVVCDPNTCLPQETRKVSATLTVSPQTVAGFEPAEHAAAIARDADILRGKLAARIETRLAQVDPAATAGRIAQAADYLHGRLMDDVDDRFVATPAQLREGLLAFVLSGIFWGAVSLVTPCVFPMIPITVSFFLKQSERAGHRPVLMATVYTLTIIIILTIGAALLLTTFQNLIQDWRMNLFLGGLFVFFALSLLGMYEIELPAGLARFTSAREGQGGLAGTIFMALTFTIVSFACVAPMLGGFAGLTAAAQTGADWLVITLGALAFSATFALPFFVLAMFPSMLKSVPKSGSWLNSVKVVMGFVEVAAALKFLRAAQLLLPGESTATVAQATLGLGAAVFLIWLLFRLRKALTTPLPTMVKAIYVIALLSPLSILGDIFSFDLVMSGYVALSLLCGVYLLGLFRLPHDSPLEHVSVSRLMFATAFILLGLYLMPGSFVFGGETARKQRPGGTIYAWVESFVLPETPPRQGSAEAWFGDFDRAMADAREKNRRLFIDFTGET